MWMNGYRSLVGRRMSVSGAPLLVPLLALLLAANATALDCVDYGHQPQLTGPPILAGVDVTNVAVRGPAAYLALGGQSLRTIDWTAAGKAGAGVELALTGGIRDLETNEHALYVVDGVGNLLVYNVVSPLYPQYAGTFTPISPARSLGIDGHRGFLVLDNGGLQCLDLALPLQPVAGGSVALDRGNLAVAIDGPRAYVVGRAPSPNNGGAFHVVDVTDLAQPQLLGSYVVDAPGPYDSRSYRRVAAGGGDVCVEFLSYDSSTSVNTCQLLRFDVTDPAAPTPGTALLSVSTTVLPVLFGGRVAMACGDAGPQGAYPSMECTWSRSALVVKDRSAVVATPVLSALTLPTVPKDIASAGDHLLVAGGTGGLFVVDASTLLPGDTPDPDAVVRTTAPGEAGSLSPDGHWLVTIENHEGGRWPGDLKTGALRVRDVSDGYPGVVVGAESRQGATFGTDLTWLDAQHVCDQRDVFSLVDPAHPALVGSVSIGMYHGARSDGRLVSLALSGYVQSWDLTDAAHPAALDSLRLSGARDIAATATRVYSTFADGVQIAALATDGTLTRTGRLLLANVRTVAADEATLLVGAADGSLRRYDLTDPDHPVLAGQLTLGAETQDLALNSGVAYAALGSLGWAAVRWNAAGMWMQGIEGTLTTRVQATDAVILLIGNCASRVAFMGPVCGPAAPVPPGAVARALSVNIDAVWPNPANPRVSFSLSLAHEGELAVDVYGLDGRHVARLAAGRWAAGEHGLSWDGGDDAGRPAASGVYLVRAQLDGASVARKVSLVR
jgi:hypothetical protein